MIQIHIGSFVFPSASKDVQLPSGGSVLDVLHACGMHNQRFSDYVNVFLNGHFVPRDYWHLVKPKDGTKLNVAIVPAGQNLGTGNAQLNKETLRMAVTFASVAAGAFIGPAIGLSGAFLSVFQALTGFAGAWAATTFIPIPDAPSNERSYAVTSSANAIRLYNPVPKVFGRYRIYPPLAAIPKTEIIGNDQYITLLFCAGYKPLALSDFRIGDAPLRDFENVSIAIDSGWDHTYWLRSLGGITDGRAEFFETGTDPRHLYPSDMYEEVIDRKLKQAKTWDNRSIRESVNSEVFVRTTPEYAANITFDFTFPNGLWRRYKDDYEGERVDLQIRYRLKGATGADSWAYINPIPDDSVYDVTTFTDSQLWQRLTIINTELDSLITVLTAVTAGERLISRALMSVLRRRVGELDNLIDARLTDSDLTIDQRTILAGTGTKLGSLLSLINTGIETTSEISEAVSTFNDKLSAFLAVADIVDGYVRVNRCRVQGYGPDLSTLSWFQRYRIKRWGLERLFGAAPEGAFTYISDLKYKGLLRKTFTFWFDTPAQYEIQIRRLTEDKPEEEEGRKGSGEDKEKKPGQDYDYENDCNIYALHCVISNGVSDTGQYVYSPPVSDEMARKVVLIALRMKANEQLNNSVQQFNCIAQAPVCRCYYDANTGRYRWTAPSLEEYRNPAWAFAEVLRSDTGGNKYGLSPDDEERLDCAKLIEFAAYCKSNKYYFDGVFDSKSTVQAALKDICRVGKATPTIRDGKFSVVMDNKTASDAPSAIITERNSAEFSCTKMMVPVADALRVKFTNEENSEYKQDEIIVYNDGYGPAYTNLPQPERIEDVDLFGVTTKDHAYRIGRYMLACSTLRPETIEVSMDWEHLVFERGDLVTVQHNVVMWGLGSGRVASVTESGGLITGVTLDELVTLTDGKSYQAKIRTKENTVLTGTLETPSGGDSSYSMTFSPGIDPGAYTVEAGCLILWGEEDTVSVDCIVKEIRPESGLKARVVMVENAPDVHAAELKDANGNFLDIPDFDSKITLPISPIICRPPRIEILGITTDATASVRQSDGSLQSRIKINIKLPEGKTAHERAGAARVDHVELQYRSIGYERSSKDPSVNRAPWVATQSYMRGVSDLYIAPVEDGEYYDIRVRSVTTEGVCSEWTYCFDVLVLGKSDLPPDVYDLNLSTRTLTWKYNAPLDHAGFRVKGIYGEGCTWDSAASLHDGLILDTRFDVSSMEDGVRTYMVKAVDTSGNESANAQVWVRDYDGITIGGTLEGTYPAIVSGGVDANYTTLSNMEYDAATQKVVASAVVEPYAHTFYRDGDGHAPFYKSDSSSGEGFYQTTYPECSIEFASVQYYFHLTKDEMTFVDVDATGEHWLLYMKDDFSDLWKSSLDSDLWPTEMEDNLWPDRMDWTAIHHPVSASDVWEKLPSGFYFKLKALASNTQFQVSKFDALVWTETPASK